MSHRPPRCPGCGYDHTGVVASWTESCPVRARCPECGREWPTTLLFRAERIVAPDPYAGKRLPGWSVAVGCLVLVVVPFAIILAIAAVLLRT